jgi:hypothetical protein
MTHLTEAEIDEKIRELVTLIKAQAPDRIGALQDMLEKEAQHETIETMPQITENQEPKD